MKTWADLGIDIGNNISGEIKCLCPWCSSSRKKKNVKVLNVNLDTNLYNCWHCGVSGSLKSGQWARPEIIKTYSKPVFIKSEIKEKDAFTEWFLERGITLEVINRNKITKGSSYFPQVEEERGAILFPYYRGEEVINIKYRTRDKLFRMAAGAERVLYGLNDISDIVVWVEGEIDKLSMEVAGFISCVSVPDGAPAVGTKDYSNKFDYLQEKLLDKVETHIIAVDNDEPGVRLKEELIRRLGSEKCVVVSWPDGCKDANDVLLKHGASMIVDCIANAQQVPIAGAYRVADMVDKLFDEYQYGAPRGLYVGWRDLENMYRVMPGEWTLVTGMPGSGKSEWLDALTINLANMYGWNFAVFSPENQPITYHIQKLAEKYIGKPFNEGPNPRITPKDFDAAMVWINDHYVFMNPELPTLEMILTTAENLVKRHGVRGLIIDPWNEIDHSRSGGMSETEHISHCLSKIRTFGRDFGVHVWVVAHPTKLSKQVDGTYPVPTPYDVAGSAHWRNKADNCITVFRSEKDDASEVQIHIQKIRKKANGRVGMVSLIYDKITGRYSDEVVGFMPKRFAKKSKDEEDQVL